MSIHAEHMHDVPSASLSTCDIVLYKCVTCIYFLYIFKIYVGFAFLSMFFPIMNSLIYIKKSWNKSEVFFAEVEDECGGVATLFTMRATGC